jgi:hypothetical protein
VGLYEVFNWVSVLIERERGGAETEMKGPQILNKIRSMRLTESNRVRSYKWDGMLSEWAHCKTAQMMVV